MPAQRFNVAAHEERTPTLFDDLVCAPDAAMSRRGHFEPWALDNLRWFRCNELGSRRTRLSEIAALYVWSACISLSGRMAVDDAESLVKDVTRLKGSLKPSTRNKLLRETSTFFRTLRSWDLSFMDEVTTDVILGFVTSGTTKRGVVRKTAPTTQRNRLWAVRSVVEILYDHECWDGRDLVSEGIRSSIDTPSRPLTEVEMDAVRDVAYNWLFPTRRPLVVALSEAGGSPAEVALVQSSDIDLTAGTVQFNAASSRINQLSPAVLSVIKRVIADGYPFEGRLVAGNSLSPERATQSVNTELSRVLREAGLGKEPGAVGKSIRLHTAQKVLENEGLFSAARFLGADSLDRVAAALRFDWKSQA